MLIDQIKLRPSQLSLNDNVEIPSLLVAQYLHNPSFGTETCLSDVLRASIT
jgi:hypothetical protein